MTTLKIILPVKLYHFRWIPLLFIAVLMMTSTALAHNVTIFAWVEGDTVYTESKFSGGRKAKDAPIEVYDSSGAKLLSGRSDENGEWSFKLPKKEELKIVLVAGMGHGNEWTLTAEDIAEAQMDSSQPAADPVSNTPEKSPPASPSAPSSKSYGADPTLQVAIEKALDKKLAPVLKKLSHLEASQKEGPGITEIIGGIGYILGLVGLTAFLRYRRKNNG